MDIWNIFAKGIQGEYIRISWSPSFLKSQSSTSLTSSQMTAMHRLCGHPLCGMKIVSIVLFDRQWNASVSKNTFAANTPHEAICRKLLGCKRVKLAELDVYSGTMKLTCDNEAATSAANNFISYSITTGFSVDARQSSENPIGFSDKSQNMNVINLQIWRWCVQ